MNKTVTGYSLTTPSSITEAENIFQWPSTAQPSQRCRSDEFRKSTIFHSGLPQGNIGSRFWEAGYNRVLSTRWEPR